MTTSPEERLASAEARLNTIEEALRQQQEIEGLESPHVRDESAPPLRVDGAVVVCYISKARTENPIPTPNLARLSIPAGEVFPRLRASAWRVRPPA